MKVKKSRFIKFFIFVLVCAFGFFGVNIMVNADSVWNYGEVNTDTGDFPGNYIMESHFNWDTMTIVNSTIGFEGVVGGNDTLVWSGNWDESPIINDYWTFKNSSIDYNGGYLQVSRNIVLNETISNQDELLYYDCIINNLLWTDYMIFEKNDFFMRLNDLGSYRTPTIKFPDTNVDVGMEIHGFILDKDGNARELYLFRADKTVTSNTAFYLYPNTYELFGNIDINEVYNSNAIMYISNFRCWIDILTPRALSYCNYYYGVQSVGDEELRYGTILNDYVNVVSSSDIVGGVADGVNSFLQIEILPGLSFFGILLLAVAVPMLIWILKIFFGG